MRSKIKYNCMFILCLIVYSLKWGYQLLSSYFYHVLVFVSAPGCARLPCSRPCPSACPPSTGPPKLCMPHPILKKSLAVLSHIVCNCITRIQVKTELLYPVSYLYPFFPNHMSYLLNLFVTCIVKTSI